MTEKRRIHNIGGLQAENSLTLIYRDQWLLIVNKPAGLLVNRSPTDQHETEFALQRA